MYEDIQSDYLKQVFDPNRLKMTMDKTLAVAEYIKLAHSYDTITFCGISGASMAFLLSHWMMVPLLCVRKKGESSHFHADTGKLLEGNLKVKNYLILDDFISSGNTVKYIMSSIKKDCPEAKCVAMLMFGVHRNYSKSFNDVEYKIFGGKPETFDGI